MTESTKFCIKCGEKLSTDTLFCPKCGSKQPVVSQEVDGDTATTMNADRESIGIWGDGNLGYMTANLVKELFPNTKLYIFGKHEEKLNFFSFADGTYQIDAIPDELQVSHAIEAVGGKGSEDAIDQIIQCIAPMGSVALMGVSEKPIAFNTRKMLEKGLTLSASSRSSYVDFESTLDLLTKTNEVRNRLNNLAIKPTVVRNIGDITKCFEDDLIQSWGKSVMKWEI